MLMLRGAPWCVLLVGAVIAGCRDEGGEQDHGEQGTGGRDTGVGGGDSGTAGGGGESDPVGSGATSSSGGESFGGGTSAGGLGAAGAGAVGAGGHGDHSGGTHGGGAGAAGGAGGTSGGSGNASGGTGGEEALHRCEQFENRTAVGAERRVPWSFAMVSAPERCMLVRVGQSVEFAGNFASHPLGASGGDEPNPFSSVASVDPSLRSVSFPVEGTFGYECGIHATMVGVVRVVP